MEGLVATLEILGHMLASKTLLYAAASSLVGLIIGALPGLTATMGMALMTTLTITLDPEDAMIVLICTYVNAIYGGSRSAILLNIPGTPSNAATTLDGYPLARQGKAGEAMGLATAASFCGTMFGLVLLIFVTPPLGELSLKFGAYEFFWLAVFGVVVSGGLGGADPLKGWISGFFGLFVATIGIETIFGHPRFTFGIHDLTGGISLLPAMVGAFGLSEVLILMRAGGASDVVASVSDRIVPRLRDLLAYWRTIIRSSLIGTVVGIVPGVGEDVGAWGSYAAAKRASKERALFGKGSKEGLIAAETGNNAAIPGAIIPVLTLGVPGSGTAAVLMAAMMIHGARPGPLLMVETPEVFHEVIAMLLIATLFMGLYGLSLTPLLVRVLRIKPVYLMPVIGVLCIVGPYAIQSRVFDIYVALVFGVIGYLMRRNNYPIAPMVLGIVLGELLDRNLRRGLVLSDGDPLAFFQRPISLILIALTVLTILASFPVFGRLARAAAMRARLAVRGSG